MSDYMLRRTGLSDDPHEDDWQAWYKGHAIGRIYRMNDPVPRYRWSIYINDKAQPAEEVALMGYTDSLGGATAAFKASFEALIAAGKVRL